MIPAHLVNAYNAEAQNHTTNDPSAVKAKDQLARLLFGTSLDMLPDLPKQVVNLAVNAGIANGLGDMVGVSDGGSNFGHIFQGVISSAQGVGFSNTSGGGGYRGGISPEAIAVSRQLKQFTDRVAYGSGARGTLYGVGTGSGVSTSNLSRLTADIVRRRGGFSASEVTKYTSNGTVKDNMRLLRDMENSGTVPQEEMDRLKKGAALSMMRESLMYVAQGSNAAEKDEDVKRRINDILSIEDPGKRQEAIEEQIAEARKSEWDAKEQQLKKEGKADWEINQAKANFDADTVALAGSSQLKHMKSLSDSDYELARHMSSGRAEYSVINEDVMESIAKDEKRGAAVFSELSKALGTKNMDDIKRAAEEFGSTTLSAEADVRNIKNILDNAYRRAAAQGRSVAEVLQETRDIAAHAAGVLGPQNVNGTVINNIAAARDATRGNRDMGYDQRTDEQVAAEVAAREASMQTQMQDAIIALDLASQGEGKDAEQAREYIQKLKDVQAGKATLTRSERENIATFGISWMNRNTYMMSPEEKSKRMRESKQYDLISSAYLSSVMTDHSEGVASKIAEKALNAERPGLFTEVLNDKMYANVAGDGARAKAIKDDAAATVRFLGNNHAARKEFFSDFAKNVTDDKSYEEYKKKYLERLGEEGYSKEGIDDATRMLEAANRARQSGVLDRYGSSDVGVIAQMQQQDQIRNMEGHRDQHRRREEALAAYEARAKKAAANIQSQKENMFGSGFGVTPDNMTPEAMLAGVISQFSSDVTRHQEEGSVEEAVKAGYRHVMNGGNYAVYGGKNKKGEDVKYMDVNALYENKAKTGVGAYMADNALGLVKGEKGGFSAKDLSAYIDQLRDKSVNGKTKEEKAAAKQRLDKVAEMLGSDAAGVSDLVGSMSDKQLEKYIMQRSSESGGELVVNMDADGNAIMADAGGLDKAAEDVKRSRQLKMLGELDLLDADARAAYGKYQRGEALTQNEQATLDGALDASKSKLRDSLVVQAAETLGIGETFTDEQGNIRGRSADGKEFKLKDATSSEASKEGQYDMILAAAAKNEAIRKQIEEKAQGGDKEAQAILLRDTEMKNSEEKSTVNYKTWADANENSITSDVYKTIETKQKELDELEQKAREGKLSWDERSKMQGLHKELQQMTNGYGMSAAEREAAGYSDAVNKTGVQWTAEQKENLARVREATGGAADDTGDYAKGNDSGEKTVTLLTKLKDILSSVLEGNYLRVKDQSVTIMGNSW